MRKTLLFIFVLHCSALLSQVSTIWEQRYNGTGNGYDEATSMFIDSDGNIYTAGASTGSGTDIDFAVVKYSQAGALLWSARYNGPGNGADDAYLVKSDNSGNVYVSGASTGSGTELDYCIVKYNSDGVQQWVARYNGPGNAIDEVYSLQVDNNGNVYITGYSNGGTTGDDVCTIKYDSFGTEQWVKRYNGSGNNDDYGNSIQIDNSGNCYVTCAVSGTTSDLDFVTIKYDASGSQGWVATYNGPGNGEDFPSSNAIDGNGNIYVTGYSMGSSTDMDYCTIKYSSSGQQQWVQRYDGPDGYDESFNVIVDNSGNVYVTGNSSGIGTGDDYCTIKYDNSGQEMWVARYDGGGGVSNDYCNWVAVDPTGNVYVTGIVGDSTGPKNCATIGYNSAGAQQWLVTYNGPGNEFDSGNALAVDNAGNVYVTGGSDNASNTDFITIRYSSAIGIQPVSNEIPRIFSLAQNYPNPFNPVTKIKFNIPKSTQVKIVIFDLLGREIETLVDQQLNPGTYETDFEGSKYSSGVYFYKLISNDFYETKKMLLVK